MASIPNKPLTIFKQSLSPGNNIEIRVDESDSSTVIESRHKDEKLASLLEAVKNKLIKDPSIHLERHHKTNEPLYSVDSTVLQNTVDDTIASIRDAKNLLDALPDLQLLKDIIISSVLSPNDMISTELLYNVESDLFGDVANELIEYIKDYFNNDYKIETYLTEWLERALFVEGACPIGVIPEATIDHVINSNLKITKEHYSDLYHDGRFDKPKAYGILGKPNYTYTTGRKPSNYSLESFSVSANINDYNPSIEGLGITIVDNPNILKTPKLIDRLRSNKIAEVYQTNGFGLETYNKPIYTTKYGEIYPTRETSMNPVINIKHLEDIEKKNVGHPAVFYFPTEAVIPVYAPSSPSEHVCYFIALDEFGNPIRANWNEDQITQMQNDFKSSQGGKVSSQVISTARRMGLRDYEKYNKEDMLAMATLYSQVVENDLIQRMEAGGFNAKDLKFGQATELYKLMFSRALKEMNTQILFLPKDFISYIAFDYKPNGVGRSLLDKTKVIGSLRMVNVITDAIANAKSSIDHRTLEIKLDPDDPDPIRRVEQYLHEFQRATKAQFPMGINSYADITDYLQKAGVQVKITGHEGMPDMGMEFSTQRYDYGKPDDTYAENLSKKHTMGLGAPPESINSIEDIEFATQIISKNAFFAKICIWRQKVFSEGITDHVVKYTLNSQPLMDALTEIIKNNRDKLPKIDKKYSDEAAAVVFAKNISVYLPEPDLAQIKMQKEAFDEYMGLLEEALPHFVSTELISTELMGDKVSGIMDGVVSILKSHFARKWMIDNNVLPELFDLVNTTGDADENFSFLNQHERLLDALSPHLRDFIIRSMKRAGFNDGTIEKAGELLGEEAAEGGETDYSTDDSLGEEDTGGEDEFSMDDDMGMDEEKDTDTEEGEEESEDDFSF